MSCLDSIQGYGFSWLGEILRERPAVRTQIKTATVPVRWQQRTEETMGEPKPQQPRAVCCGDQQPTGVSSSRVGLFIYSVHCSISTAVHSSWNIAALSKYLSNAWMNDWMTKSTPRALVFYNAKQLIEKMFKNMAIYNYTLFIFILTFIDFVVFPLLLKYNYS